MDAKCMSMERKEWRVEISEEEIGGGDERWLGAACGVRRAPFRRFERARARYPGTPAGDSVGLGSGRGEENQRDGIGIRGGGDNAWRLGIGDDGSEGVRVRVRARGVNR
jgi:hypothetical protein